MTPPGTSVDDLPALTGVRGLAAMMVVFHHFYEEWAMLFPSLGIVKEFAAKGSYAVDFFFLLSGFILCHAQTPKGKIFGFKQYKSFLWLRIARIYPVHLFTLLTLVALVFAGRYLGGRIEGDYPMSGLPAHLTLTHEFPFINAGKWNYPSWSISAEWFAYLFVFPVGWWVFQKAFPPLPLLIGAMVLMLAWSCLLNLSDGHIPSINIFRVICGFLSGTLLYGIFKQRASILGICSIVALWWAAAILLFALLLPRGFFSHAVILSVGFPVLLLGLSDGKNILSRFFSTKAMIWTGYISYSLYMSHAIVEKVLKVALNPAKYAAASVPVKSGILMLNVGVLLFSAMAVYYFVEIPCRRWLRALRVGDSGKVK